MLNRALIAAAGAALLAQAPAAAQAYGVSPLRIELAPAGQEALERLTITNRSETDLTLSIEVEQASVSPEGVETSELDEEDFLIFPPQTILQAGAEQAVQVRYVGDPSLAETAMYKIVVSQVPVTVSETEEVGIAFRTTYRVTAFVTPPGAETVLEVTGIDMTQAEDGADLVRVAMRNSGAAAGRLNRIGYVFTLADGERVELASDEVNYGETPIVMANSDRVITIPAEAFGGREVRSVELVQESAAE